MSLDPRDFETPEAFEDAYATVIDTIYDEWKDGLLTYPCVLCQEPLHEQDAIKTKTGLSHERCAEKVYPFDFGDMKRWPM